MDFLIFWSYKMPIGVPFIIFFQIGGGEKTGNPPSSALFRITQLSCGIFFTTSGPYSATFTPVNRPVDKFIMQRGQPLCWVGRYAETHGLQGSVSSITSCRTNSGFMILVSLPPTSW